MPAALPRVAPDIGPILALVRRTRLLLRTSWGVTGAGLTLGLAFTALAVVSAADLLVPLVGPWLRLAGLVLFVVPTLAVFVWKGILPLARRLRNVEVARRIEANIPGMHSRLVSCMDLAGREKDVSPAFYRKLVNESLDRIGRYRATSVVDFKAVRKSLCVAAVGVGLFVLLWAALGTRLTTALARVFNPFGDIPPASDVALSVEPGTTKVLVGEDVTFVTHATSASHRSHEDPDTLILELTGHNATVRHPLEKAPDGTWRRTLRGLSAEKGFENGFAYRVFGGRTWTRRNRIDWAERPVILHTAVRLRYPEHLGIPGDRAAHRNVIGPAGSTVEVVVQTEGNVAAGEIRLLEAHWKQRPASPATWFGGVLAAGPAEREYHIAGTFPLRPAGERAWIGTFPLNGSGQYRIELRNELGHANKPASEDPRYAAVADQPPLVGLERPGADLVLSKLDRVPLTIAARDDYGLLDLWIAVQKEGELKFTRTTRIKEYPTPNPLKADTVVASLDLTSSGFNLKAGDTLRYRVEARDRRPNAEPVVSREFSVRIGEDANAADKLLDQFEKGQDTFRDKLVKLIAEQRKVKEKIDQVRAKYDALNTKVQAAVEEAKAKSKDGQPSRDVPPPALDPKDAQAMADLRKELSDLFGLEQKNVAAATQLDQELRALAASARKASLLNGEINKQVQDLANRFKGAALDPLQDLADRLQQGANPAATPPDLNDTRARSDRVQKNLESLRGRMDALADAQKGMKADAEKALAKLKDDLLKEQGRMTARDLEELKEFLKNLRAELGKLQGKQEDLADQTEKAPDRDLPEFEGKQKTLDELLKKDLDLAKKILDREKARKMRKPEFPDDPLSGDPKERRTAPREEDTPPDADPSKKGENSATKPEKKGGPDDEEDLFKPALKGEREKLDPRFDKKMRLPPKKKGDRRDELQEHQQDNLRDLDAAQKGLKSDEQTLEEMIQSLLNASQKAESGDPQDPKGRGPADQLMEMLRSEAMQAARQMAQRAKQNGKGQPQPGQTQPPTGTASESMMGNAIGEAGLLDELDPRTRATILQLPPRVREELLQGMKAQGPEGYQKFIQDYFRRLSAVPK